jgi:N-acetylmuramate 1-kinase
VTRTNVPAEAAAELDRWLGGNAWSASPVAGDASARQYFRVRSRDGSTRILCFYPADVRESLARFLQAHDALRGLLPVPELLANSESAALLEDVGDLSLAELLERDSSKALERYREAASLLGRFREVGAGGWQVNPPFDRARFVEELDMTRRYYVEALAGADSLPLAEPFGRLAEALTNHPYTLCHRDYHGHNIHIHKDSIYLIDYQDMRMGPDTYDLASLLRDRGVWRTIGEDVERSLVAAHAGSLGEPVPPVLRRYREALLQRSIKAVGTFARLVVVYGRRRYLAFIDPTLETIRACARDTDEWTELQDLFPFEFRTP